MILLADGGSTKVDWSLIDKNGLVKQVFTQGANPFFRTTEDISEELKTTLVPELAEQPIEAVYFFGAGCANPEKNEVIRRAIANHIDTPTIEVGSDLLAAARGLCKQQPGIACIIGTGSNSCFYDGRDIVDNVSPLGYILGDEGSGAVLGKLLVGAALKNQLTPGLKEQFLEQFELTPALILEKVYRTPLPNKFLSGLSIFLIQHISDPTIRQLTQGAFKEFFIRNVMQYDYKNYPVHFTGSIAYHYQEILREVSQDLGIQLGRIEASPMKGLIEYYVEEYRLKSRE